MKDGAAAAARGGAARRWPASSRLRRRARSRRRSAPLPERSGVKPGKLYQPIRVAITGTSVSPGIFESLAVLGREQALERIDAAAARLRA